MSISTLLALIALVAVSGGLSFYLGRITAPQPKPQPRTIIHVARARLTKLDADGAPVGPSVPVNGDRGVTMSFQAETDSLSPGILAAFLGEDSGGRHRAADDEATQVIPPVADPN